MAPNKDLLMKAAAVAASQATEALQKLLSKETQLMVANVEAFEKPQETDAGSIAERCVSYYKSGKTVVSAAIKTYKSDGEKLDSGVMLMFVDKPDAENLCRIMLSKLEQTLQEPPENLEDSTLTEALNVIGNAYINVVAEHYDKTLMSMVPHITNSINFDAFIGDLLRESDQKTYILFDTQLRVTSQVIQIPLLLAVAINE
jgi:chemotaxis protein CheY-P-specific phosphatase CheC